MLLDLVEYGEYPLVICVLIELVAPVGEVGVGTVQNNGKHLGWCDASVAELLEDLFDDFRLRGLGVLL